MIQGLKIFSLKRSNYLSNTISILSQDAQLMLTDAQLMLMDAQLMLLDAQLMCVSVRIKLTPSLATTLTKRKENPTIKIHQTKPNDRNRVGILLNKSYQTMAFLMAESSWLQPRGVGGL